MAGGGKGGSSSTQVQLPDWLDSAAQRAMQRGEQVGQIGFVPYMGPDVAAFTPQQQAAFAGTNQAASAFGLPSTQGTGLPEPQTFAGGMQGYSSFPLYEEALAQLQQQRPGQFDAINSFFIDPVTGAAPTSGLAQANPAAVAGQVFQDGNQGNGGAGGYGRGGMASSGGGYSSFGDMFDGGGPGASGGSFSGGGLLSDAANRWSGR